MVQKVRMKNYRVEFAIDVTADTPEEACETAWALLNDSQAFLPIGTVTSEDGQSEDIDLQDLANER